MNLNLDGKVVLITGGTDGLGAALAARLVEEGARVAVCGRDPGRLAATRSKLAELGGDVLAIEADVTRPEQLRKFVDAAVERWQRIDALVNNAGRSAGGPVEQLTDQDWTEDLELKLISAARAVRLVVPHLRAAGGGSILNVLAISAKAAGAGSTPSAASRAAGVALTKALSKELGPDGIRVNAVLIGLIESGQWRRRAEQSGRPLEAVYDELLAGSGIPLGRLGRADDFADLAGYLLSERASFVSGTAINLDGGASPAV
jgi:NAD(P)-dependent dehydrogenase (short-subunit alcohol dehydrogenase family)